MQLNFKQLCLSVFGSVIVAMMRLWTNFMNRNLYFNLSATFSKSFPESSDEDVKSNQRKRVGLSTFNLNPAPHASTSDQANTTSDHDPRYINESGCKEPQQWSQEQQQVNVTHYWFGSLLCSIWSSAKQTFFAHWQIPVSTQPEALCAYVAETMSVNADTLTCNSLTNKVMDILTYLHSSTLPQH